MTPSIFGKDLFDDFWGFPFYDDKDWKRMEKKLYGHRGKNLMKPDIRESDEGYKVEIDLPGFKKDEIQVSLENGYLTVSAEKGIEKDEKEDKKESYIHRERYSGACSRSFYVGDIVTEEDIKGEFKHGVLELFIPKKEAKPKEETKKLIQIEG